MFLWNKSQMRNIVSRNLKLTANLRQKPILNQGECRGACAHYGATCTVRA